MATTTQVLNVVLDFKPTTFTRRDTSTDMGATASTPIEATVPVPQGWEPGWVPDGARWVRRVRPGLAGSLTAEVRLSRDSITAELVRCDDSQTGAETVLAENGTFTSVDEAFEWAQTVLDFPEPPPADSWWATAHC